MNTEKLWQSFLAQIQLSISQANFLTWFKETKLLSIKDGKASILVPNNFVKEWLNQKYQRLILKIFHSLDPSIKSIEYLVGQLKSEEKRLEEKICSSQLSFFSFGIDEKTGLNQKYTFSNFVVGEFNELAFAASQAIIQNPGQVYNPLFVYGGVGLGKTHLLQASGNEILKRYPQLKVKYFQTGKLVSEIINAIKNRKIEELKISFSSLDVLILDDAQFLSGKEKTQEEFFYIFNSLYERNKQIIISSDRPPKAIPSLTERLRSRFEGGMVADISWPDFETRVAILKMKSQERGIALSEEIYHYIANQITTNIRELEGALNVLATYAKIQKKEITLKIAKTLLKNQISPFPKGSTLKNMIKVVAEFYGLNEKDILSPSRKKEIVKARQLIMYLLRKEMNYSFPFIASKLGGKDHTTVMHACEKIENELRKNDELNEEIKQIKLRISGRNF